MRVNASESTTPVVLVVFNRPNTTRQVLDALARVKPSRLYVAADGPRHAEDEPKCQAVRAMFDDLPWACDVRRDFSDKNLGCGRRLPTGLDWVFEQEQRAIILEDDCVPDPTFFPYCEALLERYAEDETVGCVSGDTMPGAGGFGEASYRFSWLPLITGWATWRRAWAKYDHYLSDWPASKSQRFLRKRLGERLVRQTWAGWFDEAKAKGDTFSVWDYQWSYACLRHGLKSIHPRCLLTSHIGVGADATHTRGKPGRRDLRPTQPIELPLVHPASDRVDPAADMAMFHAVHPFVRRNAASWPKRVRQAVGRGRRRLAASLGMA
jgi:hypothetical protein